MSDVVRSLAKQLAAPMRATGIEPRGIRGVPPPPPPPPLSASLPDKPPATYEVPASAPAVPEGHVRLYRAEPVVPARADYPQWLQQARSQSGATDAAGRWYTDTPSTLGFYLADQAPHGRVFYVDLPAGQHEPFRVRNYEAKPAEVVNPRNFSRDQDTEFFIPKEWAAKRALLEP